MGKINTYDLKLTFIIAVYNGAAFLQKCIESLLDQDIPYSEYEIICVDDCSTDHSVSVINSYVNKYSNIRLIQHPVNMKTGTTCNSGFKNAKGKYIWFIGQDDWIKPKCVNRLLEIIEKDQLNVLAFNYKRVDENEIELHSPEIFEDINVMNGNKFVHQYYEHNFDNYLLGYEWRAIFNKEFLVENNIGFKDGVIYEDTTYLFKSIIYAQRFAAIKDFIYYYRVNNGSVTNTNKKFKANLIFEFTFITGSEVLELSEQLKPIDKLFSDILYKRAIGYFKGFSYKIVATSISEKRIFYTLVSKNRNLIDRLSKLTPFYISLLVDKRFGFLLVLLLKPFYLVKNIIKSIKRNGIKRVNA